MNDEKKSREFWILPGDIADELQASDTKPYVDSVHVIEKSYADNVLAENERLKVELALLKAERDTEIMSNTKTVFLGTEVMERYNSLHLEAVKLAEALEQVSGHDLTDEVMKALSNLKALTQPTGGEG